MIHLLPLRVYYEDTDMAGIVYYANYLKYLERGRSEAVREMQIDQLALRDGPGLVFAVRRVEIDYLLPARFGDDLTVETRTTQVGAVTLQMAQRMLRGDAVLIQADIKVAFMTMAGKPQRFPADIRQKLSATIV